MAHSLDPGEHLRVTHGANRSFVVHHGATQIATIKRALNGDVRIQAGEREWRLAATDDGWTADGDPRATLRSRWLRGPALTIGGDLLTVAKRRVHGPAADLRFAKNAQGPKPALRATIEKLAEDADATAIVVLAATAMALDADLSTSSTASLNGDNMRAAATYGIGH